jgi:hypothetical protein
MTRLVVLSVALWLAASTAGASNFASLGYSDETTVVGPGTDACAEGTLIYHHDGSFENGYAFDYEGVAPPYYGAFGEGYDLGPGVVTCGAYWLGTLWGYYQGEPSDCYIWQGGVDTLPGTVLGVVPGIVFDNIPLWPEIGQNDIELNISVDGEFTVGCWGNWPGAGEPAYFWAVDLDGEQGHPWLCMAPTIGWPTGWMDPSDIWDPPTRSMGLGVYFEQGTPVEAETWGAIKGMFRK